MVQTIPTAYSYSSAVIAGVYIFLGLHRGFGESFTQQIHGAFALLKVILQKCDATLDKIVKVTCISRISQIYLKWTVFFWITLRQIDFQLE